MKRKQTKQHSKFELALKLTACCGLLLPLYAQAAPEPKVGPNGAQLLPQNPRNLLQGFSGDNSLNVLSHKSTIDTNKETLFVRKIKIVGNKVFDTKTLHALVADGEGKSLTFQQLKDLAERISHYYQEHGYLVSHAYIPQQREEDGTIEFQVLEAYYDVINIKNNSRLINYRAKNMLNGLHPGDLVRTATLNRDLLLLNDIPGIVSSSSLSPGKALGTSELDVKIEPGDLVNGSVGLDNYGSRYNGINRYNGALKFNNPTGLGDQLSLDALTTGPYMMYGRVGYKIPVYGGLNAGLNHTRMQYKLRGILTSLKEEGAQATSDVWLSYAWIRDITVNINSTLRYTHKNMEDNILAAPIYKKRHSDTVALENSANFLDTHGRTDVYLSVSRGNLTFNSGIAGGLADADSLNSKGGFTKANLHIARLQQFTQSTSLYLGFDGQLSHNNLDSTEKMTLGGPFSVRGYETGAISGDQGYSATAELRHQFNLPFQVSLTPLIFADTGRIQINQKNQSPAGEVLSTNNLVNLSATGLGVDIYWRGWNVSTRYAQRIGATPPDRTVSRLDNSKAWIQLSKSF